METHNWHYYRGCWVQQGIILRSINLCTKMISMQVQFCFCFNDVQILSLCIWYNKLIFIDLYLYIIVCWLLIFTWQGDLNWLIFTWQGDLPSQCVLRPLFWRWSVSLPGSKLGEFLNILDIVGDNIYLYLRWGWSLTPQGWMCMVRHHRVVCRMSPLSRGFLILYQHRRKEIQLEAHNISNFAKLERKGTLFKPNIPPES